MSTKRVLKRSDDQNEIPTELVELGELISSLSSDRQDELTEKYRRVVESVRRRRRILTLVQEALSQLRLDVKYLMFDLEVTRRERDQLQEQVERHERDF
jgi:hypothetical protein